MSLANIDPTLITFCFYIFAMCMIGVLAYKYTHNFSDYILGGRSIGSFVTAMSAGASDMSGWLLLGLPGAAYAGGLVNIWIAIGLTVGAWLNWYFVAGRLRIHTEYANNALTIPDYLHNRFDNKTNLLKIISALIILFFFTIYCASGIVAGAKLFVTVFGFSYEEALWFGAVATILYTFLGGYLAVSWTDTIQASLMIFALIITPLTVIFYTGGFAESITLIQTRDATVNYFSLINSKTSLLGVISLMAWGLGYFGQPHILARFMAAKSVKTMKNARRIGITWMILCLLGALSVGLAGIAYFQQHPELAEAVNKNHEVVFIELSKLLFNPWIAGILLSAILSAVMSTLSAQLLVCSSAMTEDFYKGLIRKNASQQELVWIGRAMVLVVSVIAIYIARDPESSVLQLVSNAWAGFGAAFGPVVLFSLFWKRMTQLGALLGLITGALTVIYWADIAPIEGVYEIIPGFIISSISIIIGSLLSKPLPSDAQARFEKAQAEYHIQMNG